MFANSKRSMLSFAGVLVLFIKGTVCFPEKLLLDIYQDYWVITSFIPNQWPASSSIIFILVNCSWGKGFCVLYLLLRLAGYKKTYKQWWWPFMIKTERVNATAILYYESNYTTLLSTKTLPYNYTSAQARLKVISFFVFSRQASSESLHQCSSKTVWDYSGAPARRTRASGAPYLRKFGNNPSISKILVITWLSIRTSMHQAPFLEK